MSDSLLPQLPDLREECLTSTDRLSMEVLELHPEQANGVQSIDPLRLALDPAARFSLGLAIGAVLWESAISGKSIHSLLANYKGDNR